MGKTALAKVCNKPVKVIVMEDKLSLNVGILKEALIKVHFKGKRDINQMIDNWFNLHNIAADYKNILIIDSMEGELSTQGICLLFEMISENDFFMQKRIAILLDDTASYNTHFFDIFAKNWGLNIRHFSNEDDALTSLN
jgi:hypothetical protein